MIKLKKYQKTILLYAIGAFVIIFGGKLIGFNQHMNRVQILNNDYSFVLGEFERIGMTGIGSSFYIEVSYKVDGKKYSIFVESRYYFDLCQDNNRCDNKKFWILYMNSDPAKALVNITKEIQNIPNPSTPTDIENFK